ncbi:hypothetical protein [Microbacterium kunmingense]|uniref:hypothetical protein n=1 Tax=Microbacterium kunmingense TaxID=2915939 RepID=UPI003D729B7A
MDAWGTIAAAAIAALVSVVVTLVTMKRGDAIRKEEQRRADKIRADDEARADKIRAADQQQAAIDLRAALDNQASTLRATWEFERTKQRDEEGRVAARNLLSRLRAIRDSFDRQTPDMWGYKVERSERNAIEDASLVIPDDSLRSFVFDTVEALDHLQYAVERGMYEVQSVPETQRALLLDLMAEVGAYAAANAWNAAQAERASEVAQAIDRTYRDVLAEEEWERTQQGS